QGVRDAHIYPLGGNVRRARALARGHLRGGKAVLYTRSNVPVLMTHSQLVKAELTRIGLRVEIRVIPGSAYFTRLATVGEPFDLAWVGWAPDYADPYAILDPMLDGRRLALPPEQNTNYSHFSSRSVNRRLDRASRLSGSARYQAFARLDVSVAR